MFHSFLPFEAIQIQQGSRGLKNEIFEIMHLVECFEMLPFSYFSYFFEKKNCVTRGFHLIGRLSSFFYSTLINKAK